MKKRKWVISTIIVVLISVISSPIVHAGIFDNIIDELIIKPIKEFLASLLNAAITGIMDRISQPLDLDEEPIIRETIVAAEYIGLSLLCLNAMKEFLKSMYEQGYGEGGKPIDQIVLQTIKGFALVTLTPWILDQMLHWNNLVVQVISLIGGETTLNQMLGLIEKDYEGGLGDFLLMALIILLFGLGLLILGALAAFRYAQLVVLAVFGPILSASAVNNSEGINTWFRESIATVFTQSLQYWLLYVMMDQLMKYMRASAETGLFNQDLFWHLLGAIAFLVLIIMGPSVIKKYLHSSGVGGAVANGAKMGAYRLMAGKVGK